MSHVFPLALQNADSYAFFVEELVKIFALREQRRLRKGSEKNVVIDIGATHSAASKMCDRMRQNHKREHASLTNSGALWTTGGDRALQSKLTERDDLEGLKDMKLTDPTVWEMMNTELNEQFVDQNNTEIPSPKELLQKGIELTDDITFFF